MPIELLSPAQLTEMRPAGAIVAQVLTALAEGAAVGVDLLDLDALAHDMIRERGATSCYIDYAPSFGRGPFGKVLCTSVNDAVLHGLPHDYTLRDGDLLRITLDRPLASPEQAHPGWPSQTGSEVEALRRLLPHRHLELISD